MPFFLRGKLWYFLLKGFSHIPDQVLVDGPEPPERLPGLVQRDTSIFITGLILPGKKHIVFPKAHRADIGGGIFHGSGEGPIPAAGTGEFLIFSHSAVPLFGTRSPDRSAPSSSSKNRFFSTPPA